MKNRILKFINPVLFTLFALTLISMVLYKFGPASMRYGEGIGKLHEWSGMLFFFVGILHLFYNWSWVRPNIFGIKKTHK